jgi:phage-related protein
MGWTPVPILWVGKSKNELLAFPVDARQDAGYQLHRLQNRETPQDWKPLKDLGRGLSGVYEARIRQDDTTFRIAYVTKVTGYITVLHCWQKTTKTTAKTNMEIIARRYIEAREILK